MTATKSTPTPRWSQPWTMIRTKREDSAEEEPAGVKERAENNWAPEEEEPVEDELGQNLVLSYLLQEMHNEEDDVGNAGQNQFTPKQEMDELRSRHDADLGSAMGVIREIGIVERFQPKRGFGVIAPVTGGESVFAHWTQIFSHDKWPQLSQGMHVEFTRSR